MKIKKITRITANDPDPFEPEEYIIETEVGFFWSAEQVVSVKAFDTFAGAVGFSIKSLDNESAYNEALAELYIDLKRDLIKQYRESITPLQYQGMGLTRAERDYNLLKRNLTYSDKIEISAGDILRIAEDEAKHYMGYGKGMQIIPENFHHACMEYLKKKGFKGWAEIEAHKIESI